MAGTNDTDAIRELVNEFLEAYQHRDIDALAGVVSNSKDFFAFGTDQGETWIGWEELKTASEQLFGAMEEIHWDREQESRIHFSKAGDVAWFAEEFTGCFVTAGEKHDCEVRITGVVEKRAGDWKIVQFHRSVTPEDHAVPYLETHGVRFD